MDTGTLVSTLAGQIRKYFRCACVDAVPEKIACVCNAQLPSLLCDGSAFVGVCNSCGFGVDMPSDFHGHVWPFNSLLAMAVDAILERENRTS